MGGQFFGTFVVCDKHTYTQTDTQTEWPSYIAALGAAKKFRKISKVEIFGGHLTHTQTDGQTNGQT